MSMVNKQDIITGVARRLERPKTEASTWVEAVLAEVLAQINEGNSVGLHSFGTFKLKQNAGRDGVNPNTGVPMKIKPYVRVSFIASSLMNPPVC